MVKTSVLVAALAAAAGAQQPVPKPSPLHPDTPKPAAITKVDATTYRIGEMTIDTAKKELTIAGTVNDASTLEFIANTPNGPKAYESALTLNANAVSFNAALLLLGLDPSRSKASAFQFDPAPPQGDPVELYLTWSSDGRTRTERIESIIVDQRTKKTLPTGPWVYTGSAFYDSGEYRIYLAEQDGVLIGFMHTPQSIIDNPRHDALGGFGSYVINQAAGLKPGDRVTLTVKVIKK
jgi:hypothetical protein